MAVRRRRQMRKDPSVSAQAENHIFSRNMGRKKMKKLPVTSSASTIQIVKEEEIGDPTALSIPTQPRRLNLDHVYNKSSKLNSELVQAYMEHMWMEFAEQEDKDYIDCLMFSMFLSGFENVISWVLRKGVFLKTYVFVPIVDGGHWNLLILCNFGKPVHRDSGPCMILLDSLVKANPLIKEPVIRRFVTELYNTEGRRETTRAINSIPLLLPQVPQQRDGTECGIFMLYYMCLFAKNAPKSFKRSTCTGFLSDHWFTYADVDAFEGKIRAFQKDRAAKVAESLAAQIDGVEIEDEEGTKKSEQANGSTVKEEKPAIQKHKVRGPTCSHEVHGMESDKKFLVDWNNVGQPIGPGARSLRTFLGTLARNASKLPIDIATWSKIPKHLIEDVWDFVKRKYDVGDSNKRWILKDVSQKWKYHKYDLRRKFFKESKKSVLSKPPDHLHITPEMWKEAVNLWSSDYWKRKSEVNRKNKGVQKIFHCAGTQTFADVREIEYRRSGQSVDRSELFIITHTRKDGTPVNIDCAVAIEKIQALKLSQPSSSSSQMVASRNDIYAQVLGEDKPGRVRGIGTGPTPATLWGTTTDILKEQNIKLGERVKDLEDRLAKLEGKEEKCQEEHDSVDGLPMSSSPKESAAGSKKDEESLTAKRVKLLDMEGEQVGQGIVMSVDPKKMVMGRLIGDVFCEVSVIFANKPDAPLFIKDEHRKTMKDAVGSHILWFQEYVKLELLKSL